MMLSDPTIGALMDPALRHEDVAEGFFGHFMNCDVVSDSFMEPANRILPSNFCSLVSLMAFNHDTWAHECPIVTIECSKSILLCR